MQAGDVIELNFDIASDESNEVGSAGSPERSRTATAQGPLHSLTLDRGLL
jgi:hypothetical protein